jgi:catechol 2,3-dioxygenase-like lactoylglutathione lyase family enzyme
MSSSGNGGIEWAKHTDHVGVTVSDLDRSVEFWMRLTGGELVTRRLLDGPHIGELVGYPGQRIAAAIIAMPGGLPLELLQYLDRDEAPYDPSTAHPGNVHVCFFVEDLHASWTHAIACGALPASDEPVRVPSGPQEGAYVAYLRTPDGVSIELRQPPPAQA